MERYNKYGYIGGHETTRRTPATGEASPTGNPVIESWQIPVGSSPMDWGSEKLRVSMAGGTQEKRHEGTSTERHSRTTCSVISTTEGSVSPVATGRSADGRIRNRPLDIETHHPSHLETVSYPISSQSRLADSWATGMELSKTGTACKTKERKSHRALEARGMASHKKKPQNLVPIWFSSMKAAFCSSPMCDAHGRPKGRHRIFITGSSKTGSLPLAPSAFLLNTGTWGSTFSFARVTSLTEMSNDSYNTSYDTFVGQSSCCGIADLSTAIIPSSRSLIDRRDCTMSSSPRMHQNLTRPNTSGIEQILPFPTVLPTIVCNSIADCTPLQRNSDPHRKLFGHVFTRLSYLGQTDLSFLYLCETQ